MMPALAREGRRRVMPAALERLPNSGLENEVLTPLLNCVAAGHAKSFVV
jgi:hypothetical protein